MATVPARRVVRTRAWWACVLAVIAMAAAIVFFLFDPVPSMIVEHWQLWVLVSFLLFEASFIIQT